MNLRYRMSEKNVILWPNTEKNGLYLEKKSILSTFRHLNELETRLIFFETPWRSRESCL